MRIGFGRRHVKYETCILSVMEESCAFLGLYPYMEYEKISGKSTYKFWVIDKDDSSR